MAVYCISDIHGHLLEFEKMLQLIAFDEEEDHLYVLGDMIDVGPDSLGVMKKIYTSRAMTALLGKHEQFLSEFIYNEGWSELNEYYYDSYDQMRTQLSDDEQDTYLEWLENLPKKLSIEYKGKNYLLSHGTELFGNKQEFPWDEMQPEEQFFIKNLESSPPGGSIVIVGHTPAIYVQSYFENIENSSNHIWKNKMNPANLYNIDCGASFFQEDTYYDIINGTAYLTKEAYLGCLRLDDMEEFYIRVK